jgi:hypothetical protein
MFLRFLGFVVFLKFTHKTQVIKKRYIIIVIINTKMPDIEVKYEIDIIYLRYT